MGIEYSVHHGNGTRRTESTSRGGGCRSFCIHGGHAADRKGDRRPSSDARHLSIVAASLEVGLDRRASCHAENNRLTHCSPTTAFATARPLIGTVNLPPVRTDRLRRVPISRRRSAAEGASHRVPSSSLEPRFLFRSKLKGLPP